MQLRPALQFLAPPGCRLPPGRLIPGVFAIPADFVMLRNASMLVIRQSQIEEFERQGDVLSAARLAEQVSEDFPETAQRLGGKRLLAAVEEGLQRAARYGFVTKETATLYVYVMFTFGRRFDEDPALPWAAEILRGRTEAAVRASELYEAAAEREATANGLEAGEEE